MSATIPKRSVTFNPIVKGVEIISIDDYTPCEIEATWYSQEEADRITDRCAKLVTIMETKDSKAKRYCVRGLEGHTIVGHMIKKKNRSTSIAAVLDEQASQRIRNTKINAQAIADAYKRTTSSCQMCAQVMGHHDEQAADLFLHRVQRSIKSSTVPPRCPPKPCMELALPSHRQR